MKTPPNVADSTFVLNSLSFRLRLERQHHRRSRPRAKRDYDFQTYKAEHDFYANSFRNTETA